MTVRCAQKLWQVTRRWGSASTAADSARLGCWTATRFTEDGDDLVIAMSESTYLTLVLPLKDASEFENTFPQMLGWALQDLGVADADVRAECSAIAPIRFEWLRDRPMREALNHAAFICGIELAYSSDLRRVQRNLNELPHSTLRPYCVPALAVRATFTARGGMVGH